MADFPSTALSPVAQGKRERPHFGPAVTADRSLRYSSVSSLQSFDAEGTEGGCNRKWWYAKVAGIEEPETGPQRIGVRLHAELEHYFLTGEMVLSPLTIVGRHLLPKRGPDLQVERAFGCGVEREHILSRLGTESDEERVASMRRRLAYVEEQFALPGGAVPLLAGDLPVVGFIDLCHARGEYVDSGGEVVREAAAGVCEVIDHKTTSDIARWAKDGEALAGTIQMQGYAVRVSDVSPGVENVRLSHVYYQTRGAKAASKRTALLSASEARARWRRLDGVVEAMRAAARIEDVERVAPNFRACDSFGGCGHREYCPRAGRTIHDLLGTTGDTMGNGLFESLQIDAPAPDTTTSSGGAGLFSTAAPADDVPDLPEPTEAERAAAVQAETERLRAEDAAAPKNGVHASPAVERPGESLPASACQVGASYFVTCEEGRPPIKMRFADVSTKGSYRFVDALGGIARLEAVEKVRAIKQVQGCGAPGCGDGCAPGWVRSGAGGAHMACAACKGTGRPFGAVNPPDATRGSLLDDADPLPSEAVAEITDPALRQRVEEHARQHAARAAREAQEKPQKAGGRCPGGGQAVLVTTNARGARRLTCAVCGQDRAVPKEVAVDAATAPMPGHNLPKEEAPALPAVAVSPARANGAGERQTAMFEDDLPEVPVEGGLPSYLATPAIAVTSAAMAEARAAIDAAIGEAEASEIEVGVRVRLLDLVGDLQRAISVLGTLGALGDGDPLAGSLRARALDLVEGVSKDLRG